MIAAMQEQQTQTEALKADKDQQIINLQNQITELKSLLLKGSSNATISSARGYLKQNVPNPANHNTLIKYYVQNNTGSAQITFTDMKGSLVKKYNNLAGEGQLTINSSELPAGTYNYSLYINDKKIDSKKMVIK